MKKYIYIACISLFMISCGSGSDSETTPETNLAPTAPLLALPANVSLCMSNLVNFQWEKSTDKNNDAITYSIQISTDNQFTQIVKTTEIIATNFSVTLDKGKSYYWRVKATDTKNLSSDYSSVYSFYTEGVVAGNHLPFAPELVAPTLNSMLNSGVITLSWNAADVDKDDILVYDVYLGTTNPPTQKVTTNQLSKTFDVSTNSSTNYYWKVVVKDNKGGEVIGQIWSFKTN
ncbi:hypothetical protein LNP27_02460 [Flavobacterium galactosidilyticum]|uniref:hypothetical protein n=1 Tax=Flavobacterium galactosidilyticum TaxID=2893886 RepID=UPI001E2CC2EB|nr:hypothetical protein [Flavobacterium sp. F-340]UFH46915.1 hypothetical protein LNP27_02460 [Flavobacterium sp. F-340]